MAIWGILRSKTSKLNDQVAEAATEKLYPFITANFKPGKVKGDGTYVLNIFDKFDPKDLTALGFDEAQAKTFKLSAKAVWRVPQDVMEKVVSGASGMPPEDLTRQIQKIPGHEVSKVLNTGPPGNGVVVMEVDGATSRDTFAGADGHKSGIDVTAMARKQILIPEHQMHKPQILKTLGIAQARDKQ
jgi:hypothetical protein